MENFNTIDEKDFAKLSENFIKNLDGREVLEAVHYDIIKHYLLETFVPGTMTALGMTRYPMKRFYFQSQYIPGTLDHIKNFNIAHFSENLSLRLGTFMYANLFSIIQRLIHPD